MPRARSSSKNNSTANLGFESRYRGIWLAADSRGEAETAEGNRSSKMDAVFFNDPDTAVRAVTDAKQRPGFQSAFLQQG